MNNEHISKLENNLERLIEGAFVNLLGRKLNTRDLALRLARAMEENLQYPDVIAPDEYTVHVHPEVQKQLLAKNNGLTSQLSEHMLDLATQLGYRLMDTPLVKIVGDSQLSRSDCQVSARHRNERISSTAIMHPIKVQVPSSPQNAHLVIEGERAFDLETEIINIGRSRKNDIVVEDPYVSRHHVQLRSRNGSYLLFDVQSNGGTFVNEVKIKEHLLQSGDVIRIGNTRIIYIHDEIQVENDPTESFDPIL